MSYKLDAIEIVIYAVLLIGFLFDHIRDVESKDTPIKRHWGRFISFAGVVFLVRLLYGVAKQ